METPVVTEREQNTRRLLAPFWEVSPSLSATGPGERARAGPSTLHLLSLSPSPLSCPTQEKKKTSQLTPQRGFSENDDDDDDDDSSETDSEEDDDDEEHGAPLEG